MTNNKIKLFFRLTAISLGICALLILLLGGQMPLSKQTIDSTAMILLSLMFSMFFIAGILFKEVWLRGFIASKADHPVIYYLLNMMWLFVAIYFMAKALKLL